MRYWSDSRRQLFYCLAYRVAELVQAPSFQSSTKGETDVGAHQPKLNILRLVDHRVLESFQPGGLPTKDEKGTHPDHCEENAGGTENGFGWRDTRDFLCEVQASMTALNAETVPSRSLGCRVLCSMAGTRGDCERIVGVKVVKEATSPD